MSRVTSARATRRARVGAVGVGSATAIAAVVIAVAPSGLPGVGAADPALVPLIVDDSIETQVELSDDGRFAAVVSRPVPVVPADDPEPSIVRLHDRDQVVTTDLADGGADHVALSADACLVAYSIPVEAEPDAAGGDVDGGAEGDGVVGDGADADGAAAAPGDDPPADEPDPLREIRTIDLCIGDAVPGDGGVIPAPSSVAGPVELVAPLTLDETGTTLLANTGGEIIRFARTLATDAAPATPFVETDRFDLAPVADDASITVGRPAVSDDGTVIAFEAGPTPPTDPDADPVAPPGVVRWVDGVIAPVIADAGEVAMSGDARLLALNMRPDPDDLDRPVGVVLLVASSDGTGTPVQIEIDPLGSHPSFSGDGAHLFHVVDTGPTPGLRRTSWVGDGEPFAATAVTDLGLALDDATRLGVPTRPAAVSAHADVIVTVAADDVDALVRTEPFSATFDDDEYDLGTGVVGSTLSGSAIFQNDGSSTIDLDGAAISVGSPFVATASATAPCVGLLRPGATCAVDLGYEVAAALDTAADLTVTLAGETDALATASVAAVGTPDTSTTSSTTTTTTATTVAPVTTTRNTTRVTTRNTTRPTTRNTTRPTTRPTTTLPAVDPVFSPVSFEFAPTIVGAGRRTAAIALNNAGSTSVGVVGVRVEPADQGISIDAGTTCAGATVPARSTCTVDLVFAPEREGPAAVTVIASLSDGDEARAQVTGLGAPPPTLTLVPGVANTGQVVTIRGAGFPAGVTASVSVGDDPLEQQVIVGDVGTFDLPIVVLPNTTPGPMVVSVAGQTDLFPSVDVALLVTATSDRTSPAVLRGPGPNIGR